jgi:DNA-directed RNA polymerase specialized sigma24 family protein
MRLAGHSGQEEVGHLSPGKGAVNCPNCARIIAKANANCPHCGAALGGSALPGSGVLRPQVLPAVGDTRAYREPALVDHDHTLRRLRAAWRGARQGQGHLVSLVGENGSGRSRLIRELGLTIDEEAREALWLVGQAHSSATYLPLHLLADLLAPWTGDVAGTDVSAQLATALVTLAEDAEATERRALLTLAREARDTADRDSLAGLALAEALARALQQMAGDAPLVIVLEDLEWGDAASLTVLDGLLSRLLQGATLVIYTHHADWSHEWPDIARHSQLYLGALSRTDSLRLVTGITADRPLPPEMAEAVAVGGHGNPFLLEQATLAILEAELTSPATVPTTIHAAIRARIIALPAGTRNVLLAAALLGQRFAYRAIAMVTEATTAEHTALDTALRELTGRRLIARWREGPEVTYRFAHALIQEVAYGALRRADRQVLEARVADWLLTEGALRQRTVATILDDLDRLIAQAPDAETPPEHDEVDEVIEPAPAAPLSGALLETLPRNDKRRAEVLARIVLADLPADQRASIALCLEHGYTYARAWETLGLSPETVRAHLFEARKMFKQLHDASTLLNPESAEGAR